MQSTPLQKFLDRYVGIPLSIFLSIITFFQTVLHKQPKTSEENTDNSPERILFIQLSALGDTILAIPTIRAIRQSYPQAELSFLGSSTNLTYLEKCPYIDQRILFSNPLHELVRKLRQEQYDLVIDLEHWPRFSVLLSFVTGAARRIGFSSDHQYRHHLFTDILPHVPGKHEVLTFLSIAKKLRCDIENTDLEVWISDSDREWCEHLFVQEEIDKSAPIVVLHPEAGRRGEPRRRWHQERYVALADMLADRYDAQILLTGASDEVAITEWIRDKTEVETISLAGQTDVNQLAALFAHADLVISGNCGPMHLAVATGTPVIAIHGPTNLKQWGPWAENATSLEANVPCSPCLNLGFEYACQALPDGTSPCMRTIEVSDVLQTCNRYLSR